MDFPHLKDTNFPDINGVNVYKYQNNFDYARWQGKAKYKLLNVKWNSVYNDVPYFETVAKRDEWFDSQQGYVDVLESIFNNTPKTSIKVPLPFNDMYHYNYFVVDMPQQTSDSEPLNYANDSMRVKRWFYFIEDMTQLSPSTTELQLSIDYWTTFINTVSIPYLMLERGHAPMVQTKVNDYLANPIANNEYLLADDFNYGKEMSRISDSIYKPIGNGKKYVLFACPYSQSDFANFGGTVYSGNSTPPTFSDTSERWGYQITVNDYEWKYGNTDYTNANLPIEGFLSQNNKIFNGTYVYAIDSTSAGAFFNEMAHKFVHFMHGVQAVFILDENMFNRGTNFTFHNYTIYNTTMTSDVDNIQLTKGMFNYGQHYEDITKLYTSPYSYLEFTDDNGNSFDMRIELCGSLQLHKEVSLAFPYLRYNVFLTGVNGNTTSTYTWKNIADSNVSKTMWEDDFSKFMMNWDIPTYSVYISSENEYAANNAAGMKARREGAIIDYRNSVRYANTTYENTDDSMTTNTANVNASTTTDVTNTAAIGDKDNLNATTMNTRDYANTGEINFLDTEIEASQQANWLWDNALANKAMAETTQANTESMGTAIGCTAASSIVGLAGMGESEKGLGGGLAGVASNMIGAYQSLVAFANDATAKNNIADFDLNQLQNDRIPMLNRVHASTRSKNSDINSNNNTCRTATTNNTVITNNANAARSKATNDANAVRTQNTETANADYTRDANVVAEQDNLRQKQREAEAQYKNARLQRPTLQGSYGSDAYPDIWQRRGIRLNVRTQSKSAIAQAGDAMLRFGYALHRVWDMDNGFHYGKNFTYWKAEDIWINDGSGVANVATNAIANILLSGVTVWKDPDKIGTIGIYDNM